MPRHFYASIVLLLSLACCPSRANAQTVTFNTNVGEVVIKLFPEEAPISVANFLGYVNRGDYDGTIIHRSVSDFVVQGGSFLAAGAAITTEPPILNEFGRSNLRGTIAYARQEGNVNSATSSFFFNLEDANRFLDNVDEGFTVFGEVVSGMEVVDAINDLQIVNLVGVFPALPVRETFSDGVLHLEDLVVINSVTVNPPLLGDVNSDQVVNFLDISPFISILSTGDFQDEADIDRNGEVNFLDIAPFISILSQ